MTALRYEEVQERSRLLDVLGYRVELDLTGGDDVFGAVTVVRFGSLGRAGRRQLHRDQARPAGAGRWELAATPPISTYLFTLVAGPYYSISAEHHGIPFGLHARRSLAGHLNRDAAEILAITSACFDRYREIFAEPYPYDSYDQAFVPELESGAVENPGCVTFRDDFLFPPALTRAERQVRGMVIAHEMAHMWFGDLVTMRWWNDVWLSESFATYMGFQVLAEATDFTGTWTGFALDRETRGYDADQRGSAHPVAPEPREVPDTAAARSGYDDISYAKGASALRQLMAWLGWPASATARSGSTGLAGHAGLLAQPPGRSAQPRGGQERRPRPGPGRRARAMGVPRPGGSPPARRDRRVHRRARDRLRPLDGLRPLPAARAARGGAGGHHGTVPGSAQPASRRR